MPKKLARRDFLKKSAGITAGFAVGMFGSLKFNSEDGSDYIPYPVITIHDAFACHASYCEDLNQKLRDNLQALYRDFDPFQAFRDQTEGGEFDPIQRPENWVNPGKNAFS